VERGRWRPEGLNHCRNLGIEVDLSARPKMSDAYVTRALLSVELEREYKNLKRSAILSFKSGDRIQGLKNGSRLIAKRPFSVKIWTIIVSGLMGERVIHWLFRQYASFRISKIEKQQKKIKRLLNKPLVTNP